MERHASTVAGPSSVLSTPGSTSLGIDGGVSGTRSLVEALNALAQWPEEPGVVDWFHACVFWFSRTSHSSLTASDIEAYAWLGQLKTRSALEAELWWRWFHSLVDKAADPKSRRELLQCLEATLQRLQIDVFRNDSSELLRLATHLLRKLHTRKQLVTPETYPTYAAALFALHQTCLLISRLEPNGLHSNNRGGIYAQFRRQLREINQLLHYYPFRFVARLVEQSLRHLEFAPAEISLMAQRRRFFFGTYANVASLSNRRSISFEPDDFAAALTRLLDGAQSADGTIVRIERWHDALLEVFAATIQTLQQPESLPKLLSVVRRHGRRASGMTHAERKAIRFGLIDHLCMLAVHGPLPIRSDALKLLLDLTESEGAEPSGWKGWTEDLEIFEALLDALHVIQSTLDNDEDGAAVSDALNRMTSRATNSDQRRHKVAEWLKSQSLKRDAAKRSFMDTPPESDTVFSQAVQYVDAVRRQKSLERARQDLRTRYQSASFTTVSSPMDGGAAKHVKALQFQLALIEAGGDGGSEELRSYDDGIAVRRTPVELRDLFKNRKRRVLLCGEAGVGTTALCRKLAFQWSTREWGTDFEALYLVPASTLKAGEYDASDVYSERTLATAIANSSFGPSKDAASFQFLRCGVADDLKKTSTLVILDGVDRCPCQELLREAWQFPTALLVVSRPNGAPWRGMTDSEVECLGLSDRQLASCFHGELPKEQAKLLEQFLGSHCFIWQISHAPVLTDVLCAMWKAQGEILEKDKGGKSISVFFKNLTSFVWDRFCEREIEKELNRSHAFDALGAVAFGGLDQGHACISRQIVEEHLRDSPLVRFVSSGAFFFLRLVGDDFQFPHLSLQQYFAGCYLARTMNKGGQSAKRVANFVAKHKYTARFRAVWSFMTEEVGRTQSCEGFKKIMAAMDASPVEIFGFQHNLLKLELVESFLAANKKRQFHETRFLDVAEPVVDCIAEFMCPLAEAIELQACLGRALDKKPNICGAFPNQVSSMRKQREVQEPEATSAAAPSGEDPPGVEGGSVSWREDLTSARAPSRAPSHVRKDSSTSVANSSFSIASIKTRRKSLKSLPDPGPSTSRQPKARVRDAEISVLIDEALACLLAMSDAEETVSSLEDVPVHKAPPASFIRWVDASFSRREVEDLPAFVQGLTQQIETDPIKTDELLHLHTALLACRRAEIRDLAIKEIPYLIEACPEQAETLLELLRSQFSNANCQMRSLAVRQIPIILRMTSRHVELLLDIFPDIPLDVTPAALLAVARAIPEFLDQCPQKAKTLFNFHAALFSTTQVNVCEIAVKQIPRLIVSSPDRAEKLLRLLGAQAASVRFEIRAAAVDQIVSLLKDAPEHVSILMKLFVDVAWEKVGYHACLSVAGEFPQLIKIFPQHKADYLDIQRRLIGIKDPKTRAAIAEYIADWAAAAEDDAGTLIDAFLDSDAVESVDVRRKSRRQIPKLMKLCPGRRDDLLRLYFRLLGKEAEQKRIFAVGKIGRWIENWPENADTLVDLFVQSYHDTSKLIRRKVAQQIVEISERCQRHAEALSYLGLRAVEDQDAEVRLTHALQLSAAIRRASPLRKQWIAQFAQLLTDTSAHVHDVVAAELGKHSLETLVSMYFERKSTTLVRAIVRRLPHVALAISAPRQSYTKSMTLHSSVGEISFRERSSEIEAFVAAVREEFPRLFPTYRDVPESGRT